MRNLLVTALVLELAAFGTLWSYPEHTSRWLHEVLGDPPVQPLPLQEPRPSCDAVRHCLRRHLPKAYAPGTHDDRLEAARHCIRAEDGGTDHTAVQRCLPFEFGHHAENGLALSVVEKPEGGCVQRITDQLLVRYVDRLDEQTCRCMGWPVTGVGLAGGYNFCLPAAKAHREAPQGEDDAWHLAYRPFGLGDRYWSNIASLELVPSAGGARRGRPDPSAGKLRFDRFRVRRRSQPEKPYEVEYRVASEADIRTMLPAPAPLDVHRLARQSMQARGSSRSRSSDPQLEWSVDGTVHRTAFPAGDEDIGRLVELLSALPRLRGCERLGRLPFGGPACQSDAGRAPFVGVRVDHRELRALTPPLVKALCATLGTALPNERIVWAQP